MLRSLAVDGLIHHPRIVALLAGLVALLGFESIIHVQQDRRTQTERFLTQAQVATTRALLESELNASLSLSLGLSTFVLSNPTYQAAHFEQVAAALIHIQPNIRSVALAPDNVIRHIYPLAGNERALGLRYLETPRQREAVLRLMREQQPVIAGPVELVQGGIGIINRIPILFTRKDGSKDYWGLASVAVDPRPIFARAGLHAPADGGLQYALRGRDGLGAEGEVFLGDPALFGDPQSVLMDVYIPGGSWQLAARPSSSAITPQGPMESLAPHLLAALLALLGAMMVHSTLSAHRRIRALALQDSLTGLANRHQFNVRGENLFNLAKRSRRHLTLLNMDLDDFKLVNDTHGHAVGDRLLVHVARQLRASLRESDLVARVGGDEFLALLPDTGPGPNLDALLHRLRERVGEPLPDVDPPARARLSIGIATCGEDTATLEDLMRRADDAMYDEKVRGKYRMSDR